MDRNLLQSMLIASGGFLLDGYSNPIILPVLFYLQRDPQHERFVSALALTVILLSDLVLGSTSGFSLSLLSLLSLHLSVSESELYLYSLLIISSTGAMQSEWRSSFFVLMSRILAFKVSQNVSLISSLKTQIQASSEQISKMNDSTSNRRILSRLNRLRNRNRRAYVRKNSLELQFSDRSSENENENNRSALDFDYSSSESHLETEINDQELQEIIQGIVSQELLSIQSDGLVSENKVKSMQTNLIQAISKPLQHSHKAFRFEKRKQCKRMGTTFEVNENGYEDIEKIGEWNFDSFALKEYTMQPLYEVGNYIFSTSGITSDMGIPEEKLRSFLKAVDSHYRKENFYHNSLHAADVTNSCVFLMKNGLQLCGTLLDIDYFSLLVAAMCHDVAHPGVNNAFLISTGHSLAVKYNDQSVLENMHASLAFRIMADPDSNIVAHLPKDDFMAFRTTTIQTILSTDLQKHFIKLNEFKAYLEIDELPNFEKDDFRMLCLQVVIKCADLGHGAKDLQLHKTWSALITQEFYAQGDRQKALGVQVEPLFDRERGNLAENQIGFLNFLVRPIFEVYENFVMRCQSQEEKNTEILVCGRTIEENIQFWTSEKNLVAAGERPTFEIQDQQPPLLEKASSK